MSEATPVFVRVAQNLYRYAPTGTYYAFVKKTGRRIHRCLKTTDRKLVERRLADFKSRSDLVASDQSNVSFGSLARHWLDINRHAISAATAKRKNQFVEALEPF